jgi:hypothetical protein
MPGRLPVFKWLWVWQLALAVSCAISTIRDRRNGALLSPESWMWYKCRNQGRVVRSCTGEDTRTMAMSRKLEACVGLGRPVK